MDEVTEPYYNFPEDWSAGRRRMAAFVEHVPLHAHKVISLGNTKLYRGGEHGDSFDDIQPTTHPGGNKAAWATSDINIAARYAGQTARDNNALFHHIFEVEPHEGDQLIKANSNYMSKKGLRVKGIAGYADYEGKPL